MTPSSDSSDSTPHVVSKPETMFYYSSISPTSPEARLPYGKREDALDLAYGIGGLSKAQAGGWRLWPQTQRRLEEIGSHGS